MMHGFASKGRALHDDGDAVIGDEGGSEGDWSAVEDVVRRQFGGAEGFGKRHWIFGHVELIFCWSKIRCFTRWLFYECPPYCRFFQLVGANRAAYHGSTFTGVDLRKIIKNADKLFGKKEGCG